MENSKSIFLEDEDEIIFYPSTISNFGVHSKKIKSPNNRYMTFTPLSTTNEITFPTTIMYPIIKTEATTDTEKNISRFENEKSKQSLKKDSTRIKTESSKDEKYNISYDKQTSKILIENDENNKSEENQYKEDDSIKDEEEQRDNLKTNPFFLGVTSSCEINRYLNQNDNSEIEEKKVNKILNKGKTLKLIKDDSHYYKTSKNVKNNINNEILKKKFIGKTKKMKTLIVGKKKKTNSDEKPKKEKNIKRSQMKRKSLMQPDNKIFKIFRNNQKPRNSVFAINIKNGLFRSRDKEREHTVNKPSIMNIKDSNIKLYQANLFFTNSSAKIKTKMKTHIIRSDKIKEDEEEEEEKNHKEKKAKRGYRGISENALNTKLVPQTPKCKNEFKLSEKNFFFHKFNTDLKMSQKEINESINLKSRKRSLSIYQYKRLKTFTKQFSITDKKKISNKRKMSETRKGLDFESALKNKNNLANTQFNLFSPDKFTNTQFCGSDFCEYTLDCMDLILNKNKSQRQQKNKINFNFPKTQKNKPKKKIALFDLDETLVHCTGDINSTTETYQNNIVITLPGNKEVRVGINIRPFWKKTLNLIKKHYYIVVFTASHQAYADAVLDFMDPNKKYFKCRLYRNNCSLVDVDGAKFYVKDLDIFDEFYDLKDIVIVDNSVLSFIYHLENGIPIVPYYNEDKDGSLYVVGLYLMHIYKENDLREANKKYINLDSFLNEAKQRKELNGTINEESISIDNNNEINNINNINNNEANLNKEKMSNIDKNSIVGLSHRRNSKCFSLENEKEYKNKLRSQSKLINMYYSINDKCVSKFDQKNKNNLTSDDEEEEINEIENNNNKDDSYLFLKKRNLSYKIEPKTDKVKARNSTKTCLDYLDLKLVCSNFNNYFFSDKII